MVKRGGPRSQRTPGLSNNSLVYTPSKVQLMFRDGNVWAVPADGSKKMVCCSVPRLSKRRGANVPRVNALDALTAAAVESLSGKHEKKRNAAKKAKIRLSKPRGRRDPDTSPLDMLAGATGLF